MDNNDLMQKIVALCKRRGFIYPGSEIYGGLAGTWDYGPLGAELKRNIKQEWWKDVVHLREDIVGIDTAIMMNPKVWEASGHIEAFTDPLIECKVCHERFRVDFIDKIKEHEEAHKGKVTWTKPQKFNLLVKSLVGILEGAQQEVYLRGEITQGVHVNFKNVIDSTRVKLPFGIAQIGKAFRNEITPGNFTFRSREFEQMEIQYYIKPESKTGEKWFEYWKNFWMNWYINLGIKKESLRFKSHAEGERAHYAISASDIEYNSPWGWAEFMGIHHRGDWDLKRHQEYSGQDMRYRDSETGEEFMPWDIESSAGVDRSLLFFLVDAYSEENGKTVLKLHPKLAPYKAAIFPLLANKPKLVELARKIYDDLKKEFMVIFDDRGNIGGRYASQDEIGTVIGITADFQTLENNTVTLRDRDTARQIRAYIDSLKEIIQKVIDGEDLLSLGELVK